MHMAEVLYFGYGANRDPKMMEWITGAKNLKGKPAVLKGFKLCVQRLDQIPDTVAPTAPAPYSARENVAANWPSSFTSYTIKNDTEGEVHGVVWELSEQERELVRDWELIDFGWYRDISAKVTTEDDQEVEVQTEGLRIGQEIDREVDGKNYETWLNPPSEFERIATRSRGEYLERLSKTTEGTLPSGEFKP